MSTDVADCELPDVREVNLADLDGTALSAALDRLLTPAGCNFNSFGSAI